MFIISIDLLKLLFYNINTINVKKEMRERLMQTENLLEKIINSEKFDEILRFILSNQIENHFLQSSQVSDDSLESYSQSEQ